MFKNWKESEEFNNYFINNLFNKTFLNENNILDNENDNILDNENDNFFDGEKNNNFIFNDDFMNDVNNPNYSFINYDFVNDINFYKNYDEDEKTNLEFEFNEDIKIKNINIIFILKMLNFIRINFKFSFKQIDIILKFFSYFLPELPKNLYFFKKILQFQKNKKKFFCEICKIDNNNNNICQKCNKKCENFIVTENLSNLFLNLFSENFLKKNKISNEIQLILSTDGIPLHKTNSSLYSIWPFYLAIKNLPFKKRFKKQNIIMPILLFKKKSIKISFNLITQDLFKSLRILENEGLIIFGKKYFFKVTETIFFIFNFLILLKNNYYINLYN